jgi:hypothetical protein
VKKTRNVPNERLTLEFNAQGLPDVRVKPLKSRRLKAASTIRGDSAPRPACCRGPIRIPQAEKFDTDGSSNRCFDKRRFDQSKRRPQARREHLDTSQIPQWLR